MLARTRVESNGNSSLAEVQVRLVAPNKSRGQFVVGWGDGTGAAEIGEDGAGPEGGDFAGALVLIPTVAAAGLPDRAGHAAVNFFDAGLLDLPPDLKDPPLFTFPQLP